MHTQKSIQARRVTYIHNWIFMYTFKLTNKTDAYIEAHYTHTN